MADLKELAARIGKTQRWREVTSYRDGIIWASVGGLGGPDLESSWPLLLLDLPEHDLQRGILAGDNGKWFCWHNDIPAGYEPKPTRAEAVALAFLAEFEGVAK